MVNQICSSLWFYPGWLDLIVITVLDKLILLFVINSFIQIVKKWRNFKNLACSRPFFNILNEKVNAIFSSVKFRFCKMCNLFSKSSKVYLENSLILYIINHKKRKITFCAKKCRSNHFDVTLKKMFEFKKPA